MRVSVIVTTYNRPDALKKVIHGLLAQTKLPQEIIIADDGSSQETQKLINDLTAPSTLCPIIHVYQEDKGFRAAKIRNLAIKKSTGEYIISLDGDCIPEEHFIEDHLKLARVGFFFQGKRVLVEKKFSDRFDFKDTKQRLKLIWHSINKNISNVHHIFRIPFFPVSKTKKLSGIKSCNMSFFKKDLYAVNGFNQDFVGWGREDSDLAVRLYNFGLKRIGHPFLAICFHLWHDENKRDRLEINDMLLQEQIKSKQFVCKNGIENKTD
jgi:glycosyltransferase involved in cell wall biosynthesis